MSTSTSELIMLNNQCERVQQFLIEVRELCINHGLSIGQEGYCVDFVIEEYDEEDIARLMSALDLTQWVPETTN